MSTWQKLREIWKEFYGANSILDNLDLPDLDAVEPDKRHQHRSVEND